MRAAYNWRDEFLSGLFDGVGLPNPNYVEAYGQLDLSIGYKVNDTVVPVRGHQPDRRNQRIHGRHENQLLFRDPERRRATCSACATTSDCAATVAEYALILRLGAGQAAVG